MKPSSPLQPDHSTALAAHAAHAWDDDIVPALTDYIAIPAKSPSSTPTGQPHGHIDRVVRNAAAWVEGRRSRA